MDWNPPAVDFASLTWTKATASSDQGACVEVATAPQGWVAVRDSKAPERSPFIVTPAAWAAFLHSTKESTLDTTT
jgi:hypothetical protein